MILSCPKSPGGERFAQLGRYFILERTMVSLFIDLICLTILGKMAAFVCEVIAVIICQPMCSLRVEANFCLET